MERKKSRKGPVHPFLRLQVYREVIDSMIELGYSLVIEATEDPAFFGFFSPELEGFTGVGHSVEDCIYKARWGMKEHAELMKEQGFPVPLENPDPEIWIRNEKALKKAG
jgi:predicted RNase H-like HicB family nuclease